MIRNLHCFISPLSNESRLLKETNSLIKLRLVDEVKVLGYWLPGLSETQNIDKFRIIFRFKLLSKIIKTNILPFKRVLAFVSFFQFNVKILYFSLKYKPHFISCHNLELLPVCVFMKIYLNTKLIYVPHELETERTGLFGIKKKISKITEKLLIKYVTNTIVVCEPIANWYRNRYLLGNIFVLRNMPSKNNFTINNSSNKFRELFNIPQKEMIFVYQGVISDNRGIIETIQNFIKLTTRKHLILMGYGELVPYVKEMTKIYYNIHFLDAVPIDEIINYTSSADVGLFFIPKSDLSLSYKLSLPNKFYEYLNAGLPVIVSDSLEYLSEIIFNNDIGWVIGNHSSDFIELIDTLNFSSLKTINQYKNNLCWEDDEFILKEVYC